MYLPAASTAVQRIQHRAEKKLFLDQVGHATV